MSSCCSRSSPIAPDSAIALKSARAASTSPRSARSSTSICPARGVGGRVFAQRARELGGEPFVGERMGGDPGGVGERDPVRGGGLLEAGTDPVQQRAARRERHHVGVDAGGEEGVVARPRRQLADAREPGDGIGVIEVAQSLLLAGLGVEALQHQRQRGGRTARLAQARDHGDARIRRRADCMLRGPIARHPCGERGLCGQRADDHHGSESASVSHGGSGSRASPRRAPAPARS